MSGRGETNKQKETDKKQQINEKKKEWCPSTLVLMCSKKEGVTNNAKGPREAKLNED